MEPQPVDFHIPPPTADDGPLQQGKNRYISAVRRPKPSSDLKPRNPSRYDAFVSTFSKVVRAYKEFVGFDFLVDGLPGVDLHNNMPPRFEETIPASKIGILDVETWLLPTDSEGNPQRCRLVDGNDSDIFFFLPSKLNSKDCTDDLKRMWEEIKQAVQLFLQHHVPISRGKAAHGFAERYVCHGIRGNSYLAVGDYAYKRDTPDNVKKECDGKAEKMMRFISNVLTDAMSPVNIMAFRSAFQQLCLDVDLMRQRKSSDPDAKHRYSNDIFWAAIAASIGYISKIHKDKDLTWGGIGCVNLRNLFSADIVTHFCFPDFRIAIPLRSGDLLLFNPSVRHCSLNPRLQHGVVFSLFNNGSTIPKQLST